MADNGSNMYLIGDIDPRWNDSDLSKLNAIVASDFDVVEMTPEGPSYMTENTSASTYYPDASPVLAINSFTVTPSGGSGRDRDNHRSPQHSSHFQFLRDRNQL